MWLLSWSFCLCHCSCHWVHLLCYLFEEFHWNNELLVRLSVILVMFINISIFPCFFRYNLQSDVRAAMYEEAEKWMRAVGRRKFMGGSAPNLADLVLPYYFTENKSDHNTTHFWVNKYPGTAGLQYKQYSCILEVVQSISSLLVFPIKHPMVWERM